MVGVVVGRKGNGAAKSACLEKPRSAGHLPLVVSPMTLAIDEGEVARHFLATMRGLIACSNCSSRSYLLAYL